MAKTVHTRISSYTKNVAKSFGYAIADMVGDYNPVVRELFENSKDAAEDVFSQISDWKDNTSSINISKEFGDTAKAIYGNFKDDLKTGNWYNKARHDKTFNPMVMMGMDENDFNLDDFDFNLDEDWGDDNDNFDSDEPSFSDDSKAIMTEDKKNTAQIINSVDRVGYAVASSINEGQVATADYLAKTNSANAQALYGLNQQGFSTVTQAIMAVNDNVIAIAKLGEPLTLHMQNSQTFFTNTSEQLKNIQTTLEDIKKNTTKADPRDRKTTKATTFEDLLSGDVISPSAYLDMIKENFRGNSDLLDMAKNAIKGVNLKNFTPGVLITKTITGIMIPKMLKDTMQEFNNTLKYYMNDRFLKGQKSLANGGIVGMLLSEFLGLNVATTARKEFNGSRYEKGPVAWDGIARKALVEVIPTSLMMIYSALTGAPQKTYDYARGKFVTVSGAKDEFRKEFVENPAKDAGGEFRNAALESAGDDEALRKDIEKFFISAFEKGDPYTISILMQPGASAKFGIKKSTVQKLRKIVREKNKEAIKYSTDLTIARDKAGQRMGDYETEGSSLYAMASNGGLHESGASLKSGIFADGNGNGLFLYLRDIRSDIKLIVKNLYARPGYTDIATGNRYAMMHQAVRKGAGTVVGGRATGGEKKFNENKKASTKASDFGFGEDTKKQNKELEDELKKSGLKGAIKDKVGKYLMEYGISPKGIMLAPFNIANSVLSSLNAAMVKAIIGEDDDPESGLFGNLLHKAENMFKKFFDNLKNHFNNIWDKIFGAKGEDGKRTGGILSGFYNDTKSSLKRYGGVARDTYSEALFGDKDYIKKQRELAAEERSISLNNDQLDKILGIDKAANGRRISRTGLVAVSEGELIIPAEMNPYYHKVVNKATQYRKEADITKRFYGSFANGGIPLGEYTLYESKPDKLEPGMIYKAGKNQYFKVTNKLNKDGSYKTVHIKGDEVRRLALDQKSANDKRNQEIKNQKKANRKGSTGVIGNFANAAGDAVSNVIDSAKELAGQINGEGIKAKGSNLSEKIQNILSDAAGHRGELGAGAVLGGLGGALVGSPILGAIVGSTISYVSHSETAKEVLFGAKGEDGKYHDTLLSGVGNFMEQSLPSMGKGALLGGTAGLLLGSPVVGAVVGSAVGYVKSSDAAQKLLFGERDANGEFSGGALSSARNWVEKNAKKLGINLTGAAIGGMIGGPMGVAGGLMVGAGINYLRDSDKVRKWLFGEDGKGLKDGFLGRAHEYAKNLGKSINGWLKVQGKLLSNRLKSIGKSLLGLGTNMLKTILTPRQLEGLSKIGGKIKGAISPTAIIGKMSDRRKAKNIRRGYGAYDRTLGRDMTAAEQLQYMQDNGLAISDNQSMFLTQVAGLQNDKDRAMFAEDMDNIINGKGYTRAQKKMAIMAKEQAKRDVKIKQANEDAKSDTEKAGDKITDAIKENITSLKETVENGIDRILNKDKEANKGGIITDDGIMQTTLNNQGEQTFDTSDKETKEALKNRETRLKAYESMSKIGDSDSPFLKAFRGLFSTEDENGEQKPTILGKIFSAVTNGISAITSFLTKKIGPIIAGALLAALASGKANKLFNKATGGAYGEGDERQYTGTNGEVLTYDEEKGAYVDETGEVYSGFISGKRTDADSAQTRLFKNAGRQAVRNVARGMRGAPVKVGKSVAGRLANKATGGLSNKAMNFVASGEAASKLDDALAAVKKVLTKVCPKLVSGLDDFLNAIKGKVMAKVGTKAATLTKAIPVIGQAIAIAMGVADYTTGYQDAKSTFKITSEPTSGQKIASGVIRVVKNLTGIGAFIPDSVIVDCFVNFLAPLMGIDTEELTNAREAAQKEVDAYNAEHGTDLTVQQYIKEVQHDYTWTEKIGNAVKGVGSTVKNGIASIKEKGIKQTLKDTAQSFSETALGKALDKIDKTTGRVNATKLAMSGDAKGLLQWVFDGNGEKEGAVGVINKLFTIPRMMTAMTEIPTLIGGMVGKLFKNYIKDTMAQDAIKFQSAFDQVKNYAEQGQVGNTWSVQFKPSADNKFGFMFSLGFFLTKMVATVGALGNKIKNSIFGWAADKYNQLKEHFSNTDYDSTETAESGAASGIGEKDGSAIPAFVSQFDTRYKDIAMTGGTFAQKGCGPAVASMISSSFGKQMDVPQAIAASAQYQNKNGVSVDYFKDVLGAQGIGVNEIQADPKNLPNAIYGRLAKGAKVILLGQDPKNKSKKVSPFGPTAHYVLATGIDKNGNVIINDPEAMGPKSYSPEILSSTYNGIESYNGVFDEESGAGGEMDTAIAKNVWKYFRSKGYSETATAAIMGNLYAESGMQPESIQGGGKGPAAGIAQWENYNTKSSRWASLNALAASRGRNWTDLDTQLEFMNQEMSTNDFAQRISGKVAPSNLEKAGVKGISMSDFKNNTKDLNSAVGQFEAAFERAGTINMPARVNAAREYYKLYTGLDAPYVATDVQAADSNGETSSAEEVEESPLAKLMGLVGKIASAFTGAFSLSKNDDSKAVSTTDLTNSIGMGADAVANVGSYAFSEGNAPVDYMRSVLGKVAYSMTGPRDPEKGSADCSSTVRWAVNKATGLDIGGDTAAQYYNSNLTPVWYDNGKYLTHYPEGIQPNDVIFFTSTGSDKGAAYDHVGHVGLFEGNVADENNPYYDEKAAEKSEGKPVYRYIDHGDGMGPKEKELKYPQKKGGIIKISRLPASAVQQFNPKSKAGAKLKKTGGIGQSAAGSGLLSYSDFAKASRGSRGKLLRSRPGDSIYGNIKNAFSGAGSSIGGSSANLISYSNTLLSDTRSMLDHVATNATNKYRAGGISPALLTQLITAISAVLQAIANNTAPVQQIYELLAGYTSVSTKNQKAQLEAATAAAKEAAKNSEQDVSDSFMGLVGVLAEIARG